MPWAARGSITPAWWWPNSWRCCSLFVGGLVLWRSLGIVHSFRTCLALTVLLVVVIGALWFWFTPEHPSEATGGFYPHIYLLFIGALLAVALFSRLLAHIMFSGFNAATAFREASLCEDLLHDERIPPDVSNLRLLSALINGVTAESAAFPAAAVVRGIHRPDGLVVVARAELRARQHHPAHVRQPVEPLGADAGVRAALVPGGHATGDVAWP